MIDFKKKLEEMEKTEKRQLTEWEEELLTNSKKRRKIVTYIIAIVVVGLVFASKILISSQNASSWFSGNGFFSKLIHLVPSVDKKLQGEDTDRINILLLG